MDKIERVSVNGQVYELAGSGGGSTVMTNITYAELKSLRDTSSLVPGNKYRITDYETKTNPSKSDFRSAGHNFDIVLTAISTSLFEKKGYAMAREGDEYFSESSPELWELYYTLDNDTGSYPFCDPNGKGVIYKMVDEKNNSAPFDFKNIQATLNNAYAANVKTNNLYFYWLSYADENTTGTVSSQDHIKDASVCSPKTKNNSLLNGPSIDNTIILFKHQFENLFGLPSIGYSTFYGNTVIQVVNTPLVQSYNLGKKRFRSYFAIKSFTGLETGAYPESINKNGLIDVTFTSVSLKGCEFKFDGILNSPSVEMGVSAVENIKAFMNAGGGGNLIINSQKFNDSYIYIFPEGSFDCYLMDSMVPTGLSDLSGCQVYLYTKSAQVSRTQNIPEYNPEDSITYGYAIDKTGTIRNIPEFNSNTLRN